MRKEQTYLAILNQAFSPEFKGLNAGDPGFPEIAKTLANDIYRLCIEFGVSFNEFKALVMQKVLDRPRLRGTDSERIGPVAPLLVPVQVNIPILVFALELMPEDEEFGAEGE